MASEVIAAVKAKGTAPAEPQPVGRPMHSPWMPAGSAAAAALSAPDISAALRPAQHQSALRMNWPCWLLPVPPAARPMFL